MRILAAKGTIIGLGSDLVENDDGSVEWTSKFDVDVDGVGESHGDPDYQNDTSLHLNGKPLNADIDKFIVVPSLIIHAVGPIVMGCQAYVTRGPTAATERVSDAVVGDIGPRHKIGEGSLALAIALGIDPSPTRGGDQSPFACHFKIWPGQVATVDSKTYVLQPA